MTRKHWFVCGTPGKRLALGLFGISAATLLGACATQSEVATLQSPSSLPKQPGS